MITPATVMFIEFSVELMKLVTIHEEIFLCGQKYKLSSVVRNSGAHFTIAVKILHGWMYIDDLQNNPIFFNYGSS